MSSILDLSKSSCERYFLGDDSKTLLSKEGDTAQNNHIDNDNNKVEDIDSQNNRRLLLHPDSTPGRALQSSTDNTDLQSDSESTGNQTDNAEVSNTSNTSNISKIESLLVEVEEFCVQIYNQHNHNQQVQIQSKTNYIIYIIYNKSYIIYYIIKL